MMSSQPSPNKLFDPSLFGDALLLTTAAFALLALPGLVAVQLGWIQVDESGPVGVLSMVLAGFANFGMFAAAVAGPLSAWLLHGRRVRWLTVPAAIVGVVVGGAVVLMFFVLAGVLDTGLAASGAGESTGGIALLALAGLVFLAITLALDIGALRDLRAVAAKHRRLDIARFVATGVVVVCMTAIAVIAVGEPNVGEAGVFGLAAGVAGAVLVAVADLVTTLWDRRSAAAADPPLGA